MNEPINVGNLALILTLLSRNESPIRKASVMELLMILSLHPNETITREEVSNHEEMTARHKTWIRQILNFKLV
jgi:hypothetical protein